MKFNFFTQKLASCRMLFASALMLLSFVSGINAQVVVQTVTKTNATNCGVNDGTITINSTGSTNNGTVCYFLRVEKENPTNLVGSSGTPGVASVTGLPPGTYTITGQVYNCATLAVLDVRVTTITIGVTPDATACIGGSEEAPGLNLSAAADCNTKLSAANLLLANCSGIDITAYTVTISTLGGTVVATSGATGEVIVPASLIGKVFKASVTKNSNGTNCWGYVKLEDKTAPTITCPANITLDCTQAGSVNNLDVTGEFNGATNAQSTAGPTGTVVECSKYTQSYTDVVNVNLTCPAAGDATNTIMLITRTWSVKDVWGNTSATCAQTIRVTRAPRVAAQFRADAVTGSCTTTDYSPTALGSWPYYDTNNNGVRDAATEPFIIIGASPICNVQNTGYVDQILPLCNNGVKIVRTWTIVDMCQNGAAMIIPVVQILTFEDKIAPTVSTTWQNYDQVSGSYCWRMYQNGVDMPMTQNTKETKLLVPATQTAGGVITLVPLADANVCDMATVRFTMVASDPNCGNNNVTFSSTDSRIRFNNGSTNAAVSVAGGATVTVSAVIMKSQGTTFSITVTDGCGNQTTQAFSVTIIDNVVPQTVCVERTRATLGSDGKVRIFAPTFNNGSTDNCGIERVQVRRATRGASNTCGAGLVNGDGCFYDYVDFDCSDIGRTDIMVIVRSVDAAGNFSDCMVNVNVDDKTGPICMRPIDITRICTDLDLSSYKTLFTLPAAFDNCGTTLKSTSDDKELVLNCGKGDVTRTWTFQDCAGNTTACTQKLTVSPVYGFTVPKLADETKPCAVGLGEINAIMEADRRTIITSTSLTTFAGVKTCSAPVVETEYWKYSSSQYCQIYRIRYTIIDNCAPYFGYTIATPSTCNVMVDAGGRLLGLPNGSCTQVQSIVGATVNGVQQHIVVYERYIYVNDVTPPVSTVPTSPDPCVFNACNFGYTGTLTGSDNCGGTTAASDPGTLTFMWRAVVKNVAGQTAGTQVAVGTTANVSLSNLAFGVYTICYRVSDLCGNMSQEYCYDIEGKDCKKPAIVCQNVNAELMPLNGTVGGGGQIIVPLSDLLLWATDNCTSVKTYLRTTGRGILMKVATPATNPNGSPAWTQLLSSDSKFLAQAVLFTCEDTRFGTNAYGTANPVDMQVWAEDAAGNADFCVSKVTLNNNMGSCGATVFSVSGAARTENNTVVNNVVVSAAAATATVTNGSYSMSLPAGSANVQVRAAKNNNDDAASGVTTFDIAKVSQHVLDIEKFVSPYTMIAADVDKSNEIDATDMLHMRRFILKITPSLPGGNFRFVDKAYTFRNAANPFGEDFPEVVNISTLNANTTANFVAVKLGDVNGSYNALAPRGSRTLSFNTNDMNVVAGNEYTVNISADKMDAAAFQGTFSFNGATVKSVKAGSLNNMTDGNFGIFANAVTTSWNGKTQDASDVLAITFVANKSGKLSEMLTVNSALTQAVANDATGNEMNVNLKFNTGKVAGGEFALYQNQPNPVAGQTTIGFNLPKDGQARLTITAVDGKVAKVINGEFKAGYNTIIVNKSDLNASGVFYYRLETADHSASKKMVIME